MRGPSGAAPSSLGLLALGCTPYPRLQGHLWVNSALCLPRQTSGQGPLPAEPQPRLASTPQPQMQGPFSPFGQRMTDQAGLTLSALLAHNHHPTTCFSPGLCPQSPCTMGPWGLARPGRYSTWGAAGGIAWRGRGWGAIIASHLGLVGEAGPHLLQLGPRDAEHRGHKSVVPGCQGCVAPVGGPHGTALG